MQNCEEQWLWALGEGATVMAWLGLHSDSISQDIHWRSHLHYRDKAARD